MEFLELGLHEINGIFFRLNDELIRLITLKITCEYHADSGRKHMIIKLL